MVTPVDLLYLLYARSYKKKKHFTNLFLTHSIAMKIRILFFTCSPSCNIFRVYGQSG